VTGTLLDTNILLDLLTEDAEWFDWSAAMVAEAAESAPLYINPIIYAEVSAGFSTIEEVDEALPTAFYRRAQLPWEAGFLAGQVFLTYRKSGGAKRSPIADFYIGSHATVSGFTLLTRDAQRYRTYFPRLRIVSP
jgi:predicted nucleic acid-binding protein